MAVKLLSLISCSILQASAAVTGFIDKENVVDTLDTGFVPGLIAVIAIVAVIIYLCRNAGKNLSSEYALKK